MKSIEKTRTCIIGFLFLTLAAFLTGCASEKRQATPASLPEIHPGILAGYLDTNTLPNSLELIPPFPTDGSAAQAHDEEISRKGLAVRGALRWHLAVQDAELMFPEAAEIFSCALGIAITEKQTPHLYMLLRRTLADAGLSTYNAKNHYQRQRPFMVNDAPICTPAEEEMLRKDGSYPSGHTAIGWAWALILSEISPERADAILARGRAFGESRIICNVHWQSDVLEGRFMGAATVAKLHSDPAFHKELQAAKEELQLARENGSTPSRDCLAEIEAMTYEQ